MKEQFERTSLLIGEEAISKLNNSKVLIFGVGGVGGYVAEALARTGVGSITIVDKDTVSESNINRQIIALHSTVGRDKVDVLKERMAEVGLSEEDYGFYLDTRRYGTNKHAGYGLGFERAIMYLTGMSNIRDVLPFPRTVGTAEY